MWRYHRYGVCWKVCWQKRRSRAVLADPPDGDAEAPGLGEIGLDAATGGDQHPDWQCFEHGIITFERGCLALRPVGLEGDLRHLAVIGPACCDAFSTFRTAAVQ